MDLRVRVRVIKLGMMDLRDALGLGLGLGLGMDLRDGLEG